MCKAWNRPTPRIYVSVEIFVGESHRNQLITFPRSAAKGASQAALLKHASNYCIFNENMTLLGDTSVPAAINHSAKNKIPLAATGARPRGESFSLQTTGRKGEKQGCQNLSKSVFPGRQKDPKLPKQLLVALLEKPNKHRVKPFHFLSCSGVPRNSCTMSTRPKLPLSPFSKSWFWFKHLYFQSFAFCIQRHKTTTGLLSRLLKPGMA